jgi:two-component system phosphate regulon response regulator OmpR
MLRRASKVEPEPTPTATAPARLLVVNDDRGACELLCRLLANAGQEVHRAHSPNEAIMEMSAVRPDCVVLDLAAGGIGQNLRLLDSMRSSMDPRIAAVRVVLVAQQTSNRLFSWQAEIDAFVVRPFHAKDLLAQVGEVLTRPDSERARHRRRELDAASAEGRAGVALPWGE